MSKKLSSIEIENFRGIPKKIKIDFWKNSCDKPTSFIIFGDNGTGKSSIIDAIEFGLQGRIDRSLKLKSELKPSPISLRNFYNASIKVGFQDLTFLSRVIEIQKSENSYNLSVPKEKIFDEFCIAPIVLRRSDILKFIQTPSHQKQVLFFSYIQTLEKGNEENTESDTEVINSEKNKLKKRRRELIIELATSLGVDESTIPISVPEFNLFINEKIYLGQNRRQRENLVKKGFTFKLNTKAVNLAKEILEISEKIQLLNKEGRKQGVSKDVREITQSKLLEIFADAGKYLTESFKEISSSDFFDRIELRFGDITKVSFEIIVHLSNGKEIHPTNIFSEANLDLLALLVFLSIIREASVNGQEKILILDDVLQSVDSSIRLLFVDFLLKNFKDWQLIFSIHDRLFLNQLKSIFRRYSHDFTELEILKWDFENGPLIFKRETQTDNSLKVAISTNDINLIASQAGVQLEKISNHLSYSLPISVERRKDDKYTLGDLWPGVYKKLKRTKISEILDKIDKLSFIRNLFGAHYNEWAVSLSNSEAYDYANNVDKFYENVFCCNCLTWIKFQDKNTWQCTCGNCNLKAL